MTDFAFTVDELTGAVSQAPAIDPTAIGTLEQVTTHQADAVARLIPFLQLPRNSALAEAFALPWQDLETALWGLVNLTLDAATGDALAQFGRVVGEEPANRSDVDYRAAIRTRVLINNSTGTTPELVEITSRLLPDVDVVRLTEYFPANLVIEAHGDAGGADLAQVATLLRQARAGGVGCILAWTSGNPLICETVANAAVADLVSGLTTVADPDGGGDLSTAL